MADTEKPAVELTESDLDNVQGGAKKGPVASYDETIHDSYDPTIEDSLAGGAPARVRIPRN